MAKNDIVIIDHIIKERIDQSIPSKDKGEVYELLANEQILKDLDLSRDEILSGIIDGKDDGGIDSFYIFVNGNLLSDITDFLWPKRHAEITIYVITCKHHDTFMQDVVNNECATVGEIFDLSLEESDFKSVYNEDLLQKRKLFVEAYMNTASSLSSLSFEFFYASRGDSNSVGENIIARTEYLKNTLCDLFSECNVEYYFYGSSEVLSLYRKKPEYELTLPYKGVISHKEQCSVLLCNLLDYYNFIKDESGKLRTYLFDSNVRDYMGNNLVNLDIMESLEHNQDIDFWWLNNGVTFLATSAVDIGTKLRVQNIQIVNGLQTSHSIYRYFTESQSQHDDRCVMIKIITQNDPAIRDSIIRSTNNQTAVEVASLFATDKIQRDIEDVLKQHGYYYERRKNCYANQEIETNKVVDMMYLAAGYVCLILKVPEKAANFKQKFFKDEKMYNLIYNSTDSLLVWPKIAYILKRTDSALSLYFSKEISLSTSKMLKRARMLTAFLSVSRVLGSFNFTSKDLQQVNASNYTEEIILEMCRFVNTRYIRSKLIQRNYVLQLLKEAGEQYGISDYESIEKRRNIFITGPEKTPPKEINISDELLDDIDKHLPQQPWPVAIHCKVAEEMSLTKDIVSAAIRKLIRLGKRYYQHRGIVYDKNHQIVCYDTERVTEEQLQEARSKTNTPN